MLYIGLSSTINSDGTVSINQKYLNAIWSEGAMPVLLTPQLNDEYIQNVCKSFDGFVFCGGGDIDPKYYGQKQTEHLKNICFLRDEFEEKLFKKAYKTGKPILGICRGIQIINVFLGGSLKQHIEGHMQNEKRHILTHAVSINSNTLLSNIIKEEELKVNSFHHQVIDRPAYGLQIDAVSKNEGYIESIHHKDHKFLLGIQWHPESYYGIDSSSNKIFNAFINACK